MAIIYVRSTDGSNSDNGSTWALAKLDLIGAAAIDAAGDTIYVSDAHAESTAAAITFGFAGSLTAPTKVICVSDAAEPPTAVSTAGTVTTTGNSSINIQGHLYCYGLAFNMGTGTGAPTLAFGALNNQSQWFESCQFIINTTGAAIFQVTGGGSNANVLHWQDVDVKFGASTQSITATDCIFKWDGGSVLSGGTSPSTLFKLGGARPVSALVSGVDLSQLDTTTHLSGTTGGGTLTFRNCKLPTSWTGSLYNGTPTAGTRVELHNCDSGDTNYTIQVQDFAGSLVQETTVVRTGGASDGTTTLSWKVSTTANCNFESGRFECPEIVKWNETTGSALTATVEIITDNVTLTDGECWLEVQYLGTSGLPLSTFLSDAKADVLASAANQTTSTETWTTTGLTTPVKQKLSVTFTPQEKGFVHAVVKVAKASTTVYVDPKLTIA